MRIFMALLKSFLKIGTVGVVVIGLAACKEPEPQYTTVAVYPSTLACVVNDVSVACQEIAIYLRDTLKLKPDRQIIISAVFSDPINKESPLLDQIAEGVRKVGYKDVRTANFDLH
jgi:hypothetical protein